MPGLFDQPYYMDPFAQYSAQDGAAQQQADMSYGSAVRMGQNVNPGTRTATSEPAAGATRANPMAPPAPAAGQQNPNASRPGSTVANPGGVSSGGNGTGVVDPATQHMLQNNAIYNPNNATAALRNAMRDSGVNAFSGNPFIRAMLSFAPGLATAFLGQQAQSGAVGDPNATATGDAFKGFLNNAIRGGMGGVLKNFSAGGGLQGIESSVNNYRNNVNAGMGVDQLNPYAAILDQMITSGGGPAQMMSSIMTPFMTPQIGQAYGQGLSAAGDMALGQLDPTNPNQDVFSWLLGQR